MQSKAREMIKPTIRDLVSTSVQQELAALANQHNGTLSPAAVVEAAKDANSVLHNYFEWDDNSAAEGYRLIQAAGLIRRVKLTIIRNEQTGKAITLKAVRQFESRPSQRGIGYESIEDILANPDKHKELLESALKELKAVKQRYEKLEELKFIWEVIP